MHSVTKGGTESRSTLDEYEADEGAERRVAGSSSSLDGAPNVTEFGEPLAVAVLAFLREEVDFGGM